MDEGNRRIGLSHMEQILEFPVGTIFMHASKSYPLAGKRFIITGWEWGTLVCDSVPLDHMGPYHFSEIDKIIVVEEVTHDVP